MNIKDRVDRIGAICNHLSKEEDFPLLKAVKLKESHFNQLKYAAQVYLWESLLAAHANVCFLTQQSDELLSTHLTDILNLPNVTPNGLILPKRENFLSFNIIQKVVISIFKDLALEQWVDKVHVPANVRVVSNRKEQYYNRPRATTKLHVDVWAAEPAHAIILFIPLFGDFLKTGVEFFEIKDFPADLIKPLNDYSEGAHLQDQATQYAVVLRPGNIYFSDSLLLHRTITRGGGPRLSIDFRFLAKNKVESDKYVDSPRLENYIYLPEWYEIATKKIAIAYDQLKAYQQESNNINDGYAVKIGIKEV